MLTDAPVMAILPAADIERARSFYEETLGLEAADVPVPPDSVLFDCGDGTMLYVYQKEGGTRADHTAAGWLVEDVEQAVEEMSKQGVVFEQYDEPGLRTDERGIVEMEGAKAAWFKDTEGNILSITDMPD